LLLQRILLCCLLVGLSAVSSAGADLRITPEAVTLDGSFAQAQLLVRQTDAAGRIDERSADLTHEARYVSANPQVAEVGPTGLLLARSNGKTTVTVSVGPLTHAVGVTVQGVVAEPVVDFRRDVIPVLSKAGCNAGACHASQYGKGGFKLSVFAYDPDADYQAITRDGFRRRVSLLRPDESLLLRKPTLATTHQGGRRLQARSVDYQILAAWLARGAPPASSPTAGVSRLTVEPGRRTGPPGFSQQLRVLAHDEKGHSRDVTALCRFTSMDDAVLRVSSTGRVQTVGRGQAVVLVRFDDLADIATFVVPYTSTARLAGWVSNNFIDELAARKLAEIGIEPSGLCDDATFLRRVYLDVTGTLPTPEQAAAFLDSKAPDRRNQLIDELLGLTGDPRRDVHNNAYAAYWALKWGDLLRSTSAELGPQGMWALHNWLTAAFRDNKPYDQLARELITARGSTFSHGPANYYRTGSAESFTEATAQVFLGVRLQCARCHHHPFEALSQDDYYSFEAFFARIGTKASQEFGLFDNETVVIARASGETTHPRSGKVMKPQPLHGKPVADDADRQQALAAWLTASDNPYFARNTVNRYFAYLLGRGLVEPIDDLRTTNPASNGPLLDAVTKDFIAHRYNLKHLLRTLLRSRLYQLSSEPTAANASDHHFASHYQVKRQSAEVLLDAIDAAAGTHTKFDKVPLGTHAIELPDARYPNAFFQTFGKPQRKSPCECERVSEPNLAQALHLLNSEIIMQKISDPQGRVARLLAAKKSHEEIVTELYLAALSRRPSDRERQLWRNMLASARDPRAFYEDLLWSLLSCKQFLFVR
jgi:hypothetical protein